MNRTKIIRLFLSLTIFAFLFLGYCYLETRWIIINRLTITSPDVPKSFVGKKIVFIADIHHGHYFSLNRVTNLVNQINELQPDIILLGGDYVHRDPKYISQVFGEFKKLKSKLGIYAILGNHDHWENAELIRTKMSQCGIQICDNKSYWVRDGNDSIKIGGVGDLWEDEQLIESTTLDVDKSNFCMLLSHNPDYLENVHSNKVDFTLSGHTHGGQMTFFGLRAPILPSKYGQKYRYGLRKNGEMQSYITSGIGTITPPLRFFCRPEIVLFTLKRD